MYPRELSEYIHSRNCILDSQEANLVLDIKNNPQINYITYNYCDSSYDMWDITGNYYHFVMKK